MQIRKVDKDSRPLERLIHRGTQALSDAELVALLINTGTQKDNAIELSQAILKDCDLSSLSTIAQCTHIPGIGKVKAARILAALELGKRVKKSKHYNKTKIESSKTVVSMLQSIIGGESQEHLYCLFLNVRKQLIHQELIFKGTLDAMMVHPRDIIARALAVHAAGIIVVHNHPSGDPQPSDEDLIFTQQLKDACRLVRIQFIDHIIITHQDHWSYASRKP